MEIYTQALIFAVRAHGDQKRKYTNDPYVVHPIRVAEILREAKAPEVIVSAALLHDTVEDTKTTYQDLVMEFGPAMADLVMEVTDPSRPEDGNRAARKAIDREHLARASVYGKTIKLADLIDNTASIVRYDPDFARVYLAEKRLLLQEALRPVGAFHDWQSVHGRLYAKALAQMETLCLS